MIRNDPEGHVNLVALAVGGASERRDPVGNAHHGVHIKEALHPLTGHCQPLQTHAGVDVLLGQV